jgi:protein-tyrosine phosphatase
MLGVTYPKDMGITHKIIKAFDLPTYKMAPHFEDAYQFIRGAMQNGNILIHCAAGISRVTHITKYSQLHLFLST